MPKRMISLILALMMCLSLSACGKNDSPEVDSKPDTTVSSKEDSILETDDSKNTENISESANTLGSKKNSTQETVESNNTETVSKSENTAGSKKDSTSDTDERKDSKNVSEPENEQAVPVYEPEHYETDTLSWDFDTATGTLSIHGNGPMRAFFNSAPEWIVHKDEVLTVIIDDGITSIGAYAFYDFRSLVEVRLPDSVEVIDVSAFDYDWELRTISIPASLKYVGYRAFYNTMLWEPENLIFPEGCEYIGDCAFHSALKSGGVVSLPSTLKYLGSQSFTNAFLSDFIVSADNEVYRSENHAIYTKDMKEMLMLAPDAKNAAEFRIPDGVEKISAECFNAIRGIETVYIPASVTDISEGTFFSTFDLKKIIVDEANPNYKSENGLLLSKDGTLLLAWPDGMEGSELVIPDGVERIGEYLFYGRYDGGYTVVLSKSVKEIGTMSLPGDMTSLILPAGLEKVSDYVFYDGISIDDIYYNGTEADWEKVTIGDGNTALDSAAIHMN